MDHVFLFSQDFAHARQLFSACLELVTEFSPKLRQVMLNEMLLLEVRAHETMAAEGSKERPPPDLVSRVRGYLEMRIHGEWMETLELSVGVQYRLILHWNTPALSMILFGQLFLIFKMYCSRLRPALVLPLKSLLEMF